jgi:hypothetical protein
MTCLNTSNSQIRLCRWQYDLQVRTLTKWLSKDSRRSWSSDSVGTGLANVWYFNFVVYNFMEHLQSIFFILRSCRACQLRICILSVTLLMLCCLLHTQRAAPLWIFSKLRGSLTWDAPQNLPVPPIIRGGSRYSFDGGVVAIFTKINGTNCSPKVVLACRSVSHVFCRSHCHCSNVPGF